MRKIHSLSETKSLLFTAAIYLQFVLFLTISGCDQYSSDVDGKPEGKKYSLYILGKDDCEYIIQTDSLTGGILSPEKNGIKTEYGTINRELMVKDGYYYFLKRKQQEFTKYKNTGKNLQAVASLPMDNFSIENFYWISSDTLLLIGLDAKTFTLAKYYKITVDNFKIAEEGSLPVPKPSGKFSTSSIGVTELRNNKLILSYTHHIFQESAVNYSSSDTIYNAVISYPEMTLNTIEKDTRSAYPGGINTIQSYSFNDENGNLYFMSCPGIAMGNTTHKPTAIFRINSGENIPDKNYFFNISASKIQNHAYGLWYLGNNKAIIRSERKDLYKSFNDHHSTSHFEFYLLDLINQSVEKLNLPLDKGTRRECVIVEDDIAYIAINSTTEGNYIWLYNIKTNTLKKGLQLSGNTDFILKMHRN